MTNEPMSDRPATPGERLPIERPVEPAPVERFSAPASAHAFGLTPERAAGIVRQSASARTVGFLAILVVVLFVTIYYLYELGFPSVLKGLPFVPAESRLAAETEDQQVTLVEAGYNIFQANCARCHGEQGQGGIGPVLNDQSKLFSHLSEGYLRNVLIVGGRYVCGNANSLMPAWADISSPPGPLNYMQINELIAFLRATNEREYLVRDPGLLEPVVDASTGQEKTFTGWRDPAWEPAPDATPVPACWADAFASGGGATPAPTMSGGGGTAAATLELGAQNIAYDTAELQAPADKPFEIVFANNDAGIPHNVEILDANRTSVWKGDIFNGVETRTYQVPALAAGTYSFVCTVHPNMMGTLTVAP